MGYRDLFLTPQPRVSQGKQVDKPLALLFGVPFDATSTYRPGSRFGPDAIREAFLNIELYSRRLDIDLEQHRIEDLGNLYPTSNIESMLSAVEKVCREVVESAAIAILGGEHSLTYASYKAMPEDTALVIFDAHLDMRDEFGDMKLSHATFLRRLIEERGGEQVMHLGARAATKEEWAFAEANRVTTLSAQGIFQLDGCEKLLRDFLKGFEGIYVSIDLDVLDPAFAPGVGNPEAGGLTSWQLLNFLYALEGRRIRGFDIVELAPAYDNGSTACLAARLLAELLCLAAKGA